MLTLGTIGTSWITDSFVKAAHNSGKFKLTTVYSRSTKSAESLANRYGARIVTSLPLNADVVYIASPNSLHYQHAKTCLSNGSHVILEKPAASTPSELDDLFRVAKQTDRFLLEAYRHLHEANFHRIDLDHLGEIFGASLTYASYSSRYDNVLRGETPNIFSLDFSGGSLVDLGCYCISFAVALFGPPKGQTYSPYICRTGVDAGGPITLQYDKFSVQINQSKCYTSSAPSEIYGEKGTLILNGTTDIQKIKFWDCKTKESTELAEVVKEGKSNMQDEAEEFARIIEQKDLQTAAKLESISREVLRITSELRSQNGILFAVEKE